MARFQRDRSVDGEQKTTALELFYDLVFVFAITQVSHLLLHHLTWTGLAHATIVLGAVWWGWNYTTWATNELDPESPVVRALMLVLTLASLLLAVAIPEAFDGRAGLFVGAYLALQLGRSAFLTFAVAPAGALERQRASRILIWFACSGVFWVAGAIADGNARAWLWVIALAIDYGAPLTLYRVPGLRPLTNRAWDVETSHFAERFQLFVIIALGESVVATGATTSELHLDAGRLTAFVVAFAGSAALWWLYFTYVARIAERRLAMAHEDRVAMARDGYTYLHVLLVAGVIVAAVGDELVIAAPGGRLGGAELAAVVAGPAIYLLGHALFRLRLAGSLSVKRLAGAAGCVACGALGAVAPALVVAAAVVAVLAAVIVAEEVAAARRTARGEPSPLERLELTAER